MATILSALVPVFLLIALGYGFRRWRFLPESLWPPLEKLTYFVFFPALLFVNCLRVPLNESGTGVMALSMGLGVLIVAGLAMGALALIKDRPAFTSLFQGTIRPNTYVGLAAAAALYGPKGVALTSVCVGVVVPLVNFLSVSIMLVFADRARPKSLLAALKPVIANPLINACLLGLALNHLQLPLPAFSLRFFDILASASLPLGLLAVGAGIDVQALPKAGPPVFISSLLKMLVLPLISLGLLKVFEVGGEALAAGFLYATLPCSATSYVLARQMGGDAGLMASIISVQTLLAMGSMPILLVLFGFTP
ncbi:Auxin efflux carrier family protein [Rhodospirillaceae bacterium LM-1]|nr:Auxin efflux carrier family protein [Rhodospirillaceae bacterium LM-1]